MTSSHDIERVGSGRVRTGPGGSRWHRVGAGSVLASCVGLAALTACHSDPVGHSKTTETKTIDTPTEKTTTTETREKDTTYSPK